MSEPRDLDPIAKPLLGLMTPGSYLDTYNRQDVISVYVAPVDNAYGLSTLDDLLRRGGISVDDCYKDVRTALDTVDKALRRMGSPSLAECCDRELATVIG